jgi:ABC-type xylose transport system permease subunit
MSFRFALINSEYAQTLYCRLFDDDLKISFVTVSLPISVNKILLLADSDLTCGSRNAFCPADLAMIEVPLDVYPLPELITITLVILLSAIIGLNSAPIPSP